MKMGPCQSQGFHLRQRKVYLPPQLNNPLIVLSQGNKKVIIPADQFLKTFHGVSKHETDVRGIFLFLEKNLCIK